MAWARYSLLWYLDPLGCKMGPAVPFPTPPRSARLSWSSSCAAEALFSEPSPDSSLKVLKRAWTFQCSSFLALPWLTHLLYKLRRNYARRFLLKGKGGACQHLSIRACLQPLARPVHNGDVRWEGRPVVQLWYLCGSRFSYDHPDRSP